MQQAGARAGSLAERAGSCGPLSTAIAQVRPIQFADPIGYKRRMKAGLSIVVPLYNEANGLARLHERLSAVARKLTETRDLSVEVVYVDDGSGDDTLKIARNLPATALDVQVLALSRNFGKEAALAAGLDHAARGAVLFMDGDGQHPPALIETLVGHWLDGGYDVIYTAKAHREHEPALRRLGSRTFYALLNWGARHKIPEDAGDFRLLSPRAALALRQMPERNRFFKGLASWIGFRQIRVDYEPDERLHGTTAFGWTSLIGLSIEGLTSFSVAPPSFSHAEASALSALNADTRRVAIGLHLTLTGPLKPLTSGYRPRAETAFLPLATTLRLAMQQRLDMAALAAEFRAQFEAFT